MIKNYNKCVKINHNPNWLYIPTHPYRILIIGGLGPGKANVLLNLKNINDQVLIKFTYMSTIHSNQRMNCLLRDEKE